MDVTERLVFEHLKTRGMGDARYEPDGNVPPDFLWRGVAIEARRLNQHDAMGSGLEVSAIPLVMKVTNLLKDAGPANGGSWFVSFRFRRPIEPWKTLAPKIRQTLAAFDPNHLAVEAPRARMGDCFSMGFAASSKKFDQRFVLGGYSDHDSGGFVVAELIKNIKTVLAEKTRKVEKYQTRYSEWWLTLVDQIGYARLDAHEAESLREHIQVPDRWKKVVLIDPLDPRRYFEICRD
jgi:hypothetical protein